MCVTFLFFSSLIVHHLPTVFQHVFCCDPICTNQTLTTQELVQAVMYRSQEYLVFKLTIVTALRVNC